MLSSSSPNERVSVTPRVPLELAMELPVPSPADRLDWQRRARGGGRSAPGFAGQTERWVASSFSLKVFGFAEQTALVLFGQTLTSLACPRGYVVPKTQTAG